jgi:hypothetical protein
VPSERCVLISWAGGGQLGGALSVGRGVVSWAGGRPRCLPHVRGSGGLVVGGAVVLPEEQPALRLGHGGGAAGVHSRHDVDRAAHWPSLPPGVATPSYKDTRHTGESQSKKRPHGKMETAAHLLEGGEARVQPQLREADRPIG